MKRRAPRSRLFLALVGVGIAAMALLAPAAVLGRSTLESADPAANSTVPESPTLIMANFTERIDPARSSMELLGPDGSVLAKGGVAPGDPEAVQMTISSPTLGIGTYEVRWTTVTPNDSAIERGTYTITVVAASSAPARSATPATPPTPTAAEEATAEASAPAEASEAPEQPAGPSAPADGSPVASPAASGGGSGGSGPDLVVVGGFALLAIVVVGMVVLVARSRRA